MVKIDDYVYKAPSTPHPDAWAQPAQAGWHKSPDHRGVVKAKVGTGRGTKWTVKWDEFAEMTTQMVSELRLALPVPATTNAAGCPQHAGRPADAGRSAGSGKRAASDKATVYFIDTDEEVTSDEDSDDEIKDKVDQGGSYRNQKQPRTVIR